MTLSEFRQAVSKEIELRQDLKEEILDLWELAMTEIEEETGSALHEMELCLETIKQLKNDNRK